LNHISKQYSVSIRKQDDKQNDNRPTTFNTDDYEDSTDCATLHEMNLEQTTFLEQNHGPLTQNKTKQNKKSIQYNKHSLQLQLLFHSILL
jgi:hypothetical protein